MQTFYPGVYFKEVEFAGGARPVQGVDMSIGACVGFFEKGPIGVPVRVTAANFTDVFGGPIEDAYGWYVLSGFFKNNPSGQCYVVRTTKYSDITDKGSSTAKISEAIIKDNATVAKDALSIEARDAGVAGNKISVECIPSSIVDTILTKKAEENTNEINVRSTNSMKGGMSILVGEEVAVIKSFDSVTRVVTLEENLEEDVADKSVVKSSDFNLTVKYKSKEEFFENLSVDRNSERFFETICNDDETGSSLIYVYEENEAVFPSVPVTASPVFLTGGDDGLLGVGDVDIIGDVSSGTGLYALDSVPENLNIFSPESCSEEVNRAILAYNEGRMDCFGVLSVPESIGVDSAVSYRNETGNFNSSYGALYYGWGYVADPIGVGSNPKKLVPLCGHIAGYYGRSDNKYDIGQVPAGEDAVLLGVDKLEYNISDIDNGVLNKNNVNAIRSLSGAGIVVWGARTLSADTNWRYINARRIFIYVEKSIAIGTRWVVFKPSNPSTWKSIVRTVESFLNTVPGLFGDSPNERYLVICDETTNPEPIRKAGQIVCKIGISIASVGEFVIFEIGQMSEGTSLTE